MFETHERILQKLNESGLEQFSSEMIKGIITSVEHEEVDRMYEDCQRETEPYTVREGEVVSWEDAAEGLREVSPPPQPIADMECEP